MNAECLWVAGTGKFEMDMQALPADGTQNSGGGKLKPSPNIKAKKQPTQPERAE